MRVDFYLLKDEQPEAPWLVACRLLEKAYYKGHQVFAFCKNQQDAEKLDELLWTFKEESFVPHNLQGEGPEPPPPIQIGFGAEPRGFHDILLNMTAEIPAFHGRFKRIIEIVSNNESTREVSRQHYRDYRAKGYQLETHDIG